MTIWWVLKFWYRKTPFQLCTIQIDTMQRLQIAVVGLGRMVSKASSTDGKSTLIQSQGKRHVHTLLYRVPKAQVVAVCSTEPSEINWATADPEYREFGIKVYHNYDEMLEHPGLQAVWISTRYVFRKMSSLPTDWKILRVFFSAPTSTVANH